MEIGTASGENSEIIEPTYDPLGITYFGGQAHFSRGRISMAHVIVLPMPDSVETRSNHENTGGPRTLRLARRPYTQLI